MDDIIIPAGGCDEDCQFFVEIGSHYAKCALFKKDLFHKAYYDPDFKKCDECIALDGKIKVVNIIFEKDTYYENS